MILDKCPYCDVSLAESEIKIDREGNKHYTLYCDNKDCKYVFGFDVDVN